ncbi:MAG TPA: hypothetical protein VFI62_04865, partial [Burkholderiales bacterium]|nr:hypothetical protein [Burkholderiales bacterium]
MSTRIRPDYLIAFAELASSARLDTLSREARDRARLIIADCIPVIAAGMQEPEMKALVARHQGQAGIGHAWV